MLPTTHGAASKPRKRPNNLSSPQRSPGRKRLASERTQQTRASKEHTEKRQPPNGTQGRGAEVNFSRDRKKARSSEEALDSTGRA